MKNNYKDIVDNYQKAIEEFAIEMMKKLTPAIKKATETLMEISKGKKVIEDLELIEEDDNGET